VPFPALLFHSRHQCAKKECNPAKMPKKLDLPPKAREDQNRIALCGRYLQYQTDLVGLALKMFVCLDAGSPWESTNVWIKGLNFAWPV
jgi:hypothetical protein